MRPGSSIILDNPRILAATAASQEFLTPAKRPKRSFDAKTIPFRKSRKAAISAAKSPVQWYTLRPLFTYTTTTSKIFAAAALIAIFAHAFAQSSDNDSIVITSTPPGPCTVMIDDRNNLRTTGFYAQSSW
jgi:hypothetical protein